MKNIPGKLPWSHEEIKLPFPSIGLNYCRSPLLYLIERKTPEKVYNPDHMLNVYTYEKW
jgi:hypothetical protein